MQFRRLLIASDPPYAIFFTEPNIFFGIFISRIAKEFPLLLFIVQATETYITTDVIAVL
jgi:hypothetical protein